MASYVSNVAGEDCKNFLKNMTERIEADRVERSLTMLWVLAVG